jgi:hypothetical protein
MARNDGNYGNALVNTLAKKDSKTQTQQPQTQQTTTQPAPKKGFFETLLQNISNWANNTSLNDSPTTQMATNALTSGLGGGYGGLAASPTTANNSKRIEENAIDTARSKGGYGAMFNNLFNGISPSAAQMATLSLANGLNGGSLNPNWNNAQKEAINTASQKSAAAAGITGYDTAGNPIKKDDLSWLTPDYREKYADMLMTPAEYQARLQSKLNEELKNNPTYAQEYNAWLADAETASAAGIDITSGSEWALQHPRPRASFEPTYQEEYLRNLAAPTGYAWTPYGSGFMQKPQLPSMNSVDSSGGGGTQSGNMFGGGLGISGYGGYGGYGYGSSQDDINQWYANMVQWNINKPK